MEVLVNGVRGTSEGREQGASMIVIGACGDLRRAVRRMVGVVERKSPPRCSSVWVERGVVGSGGREEGANGRKWEREDGRGTSMEGRGRGGGAAWGSRMYMKEREGGEEWLVIRKRGEGQPGEKGKSMSGQGIGPIVFTRGLCLVI